MSPRPQGAARSVLSLLCAAVILLLSASPAGAWSEGVYVIEYGVDQEQKTKCNCVPASARYWIRYTRSEEGTPSQQTLGNYMAYPKDRNDFWDTGAWPCTVAEGNPYYSTPHDAQGWAWAMYNYATTNHSKGYDDYIFNSQATANWQIVWNIRATERPVGVIVKAGKHAILAVGYTTDYNPWLPQASEIYGFRVWDPWFGREESIGFNNYPSTGFEGNEYISLATWNQYIFKKDINEGQYYDEKYVLVLQKSTTTQPGISGISYGEYIFNQQQGLMMTESPMLDSSGIATAEEPRSSLDEAVSSGLRKHGLLHDEQMGLDLSGYRIGRVVSVEALDASSSPYNLSELWVGAELRAVVLTWREDSGHVFGALVKANSNRGLPSADDLSSAAVANEMTGRARLVWGANTTDEADSPFFPFVAARDRSTGLEAYVTATGRRDAATLVGD
jgi:hypothetical protein